MGVAFCPLALEKDCADGETRRINFRVNGQ